MTADDLNALVSEAYDAAFQYEAELEAVYRRAFRRASRDAAKKFSTTVVVAAGFVPPPVDTLTSGLTEKEQAQADRVATRQPKPLLPHSSRLALPLWRRRSCKPSPPVAR